MRLPLLCPTFAALLHAVTLTLLSQSAHAGGAAGTPNGPRMVLTAGWRLQSSVLVKENGAAIATPGFRPDGWFTATAPTTVLRTLVAHGVYPDPRIGLNALRIPDSSDEFNRKHDLARFSHLPDRRNPWRGPWWFRTEFSLGRVDPGRVVWLGFDCLNYRAEVWLNGARVAGPEATVGMFQRFRFDVARWARAGTNALAVKVFPVDHPGEPETQLDVFGKDRDYHTELMKDVTSVTMIGYDCMGTVPDRNMGLIQDVFVEQTGPVVVRHPFVVTRLPLPATDRATLDISAELTNATSKAVAGTLRGKVEGTDVAFAVPVELAAG
jgi:hypothetical protein